MIIIANTAFTLQWTLTDGQGVPVNVAAMTATLYQGRSAINPTGLPGAPVAPLVNVALAYVAASNGVYQAAEPATLNPTPAAGGLYPSFTLVIDASVSSTPVYHHEEPLSVQTAVESNAVDLTTVAAVVDEAMIKQPAAANTQAILQDYITGFSLAVLKYTGIPSFIQPVLMTETRNGNGNYQMFTRMRPVINVSAITVSGVAVPAAGAWPSWGYFVADDGRSIWIRQSSSPISFSGYSRYPQSLSPGFSSGIGNVTLKYWAGYDNVPSDLEIAARKMVSIYYGRKQTRDLASTGVAAGGTTASTRYRDWKCPPEVECVIEHYRRLAII